MAGLTFSIVDVFSDRKFAGNQLAVVRGGAELTDGQMQEIAREFNFSETTFLLSEEPRAGGYDVRIFTPYSELPFAGHPTLGTAHVIQQEVAGASATGVTLNLPVGPVPVVAHPVAGAPDLLWMTQPAPRFGATVDAAAAAPALGLDPADLDGRFPIQEVSTGLPTLILPLSSRDALQRCRIQRDPYLDLVRDRPAKNLLVFCTPAFLPENHLSVRVFAEFFGVPEDPATGSANGCLAAYLVHYRFFGAPAVDVRVEQGREMGRPSLLRLKAHQQEEEIVVAVGGQCVTVARGHLL